MRFLFILPIIFASCIAGFSQTAPLPSKFQSWNEVQLIVPLVRSKDAKGKSIDRLTATFNGTLRIGRKNLDFLDNRAGVAIDWRINRYFSILTGGSYRRDELVVNVRRFETRFNTGVNFSETWRKISFRDRNLYEHRFRNGRADLDVYRQRIQASYSFKRGGKELFAPFVSEEGFYDLHLKTWFRNEFYIGITRKLSKKTALDIAYIRNDTRPVNVNGISLNLKIRLR